MRILVVEDDELLSRSLVRGLGAEGYVVDVARDGCEGLYLAREHAYDALVLDLLLPKMNGYQVCAELRAAGEQLPILMLTAKSGEWDVAEGLDTGADDDLVKPFHYPVLLARLRALLRRGQARLSPLLSYGPLTMDPGRHRCTLRDEELDLTPRKFTLLCYLLSQPAFTHTKQELLDHVWGEREAGDQNVVQVYVSALRRKVDQAGGPSFIQTVHDVGYRLADLR